ncbi:sensor histidine kinase [Clostridium sp. LBM24168]
MFRKLKLELILINLILTGLVLFTIFSGIYILMQRSFDNSAYMRMAKTARMENIPPLMGPPEKRLTQSEDFFIKVDENENIIDVSLNSILSKTESQNVVKKIFDMEEDKGTVNYKDLVLRYIRVPKSYGFIIVLLDKSVDNEVLKRLIIISAVICIISLVLVFIISLFLANISLKPVIGAWEKQKAFVADASHELRTPLAVITTNLDIVLDNDDELVSNQKKWLGNIKLETDRMTKLIESLLFLARSDSNKTHVSFMKFDLSNAVIKSVVPFEAVCMKNGIDLKSNIESDIIFTGNEGRIKQLIAILVDNAVKHTPEGGSINIKMNRIKNGIEILVSDTGEGIAENHLNKIFDRFYKVDKSRAKREGNFGLGLAIAKTIVEEHRGSISVSSVVGKGSTFRIVFGN